MTFQKLLLASAIAALSSASFAMEAMDESAMSATTGQDGLSISLSTNLSLDMILHDKDGFAANTDSGAMAIRGIAIDNGTVATNADLRIDIDAGGTTEPTLQIGVFNTSALRLKLGTLTVANSSRTGTGTNGSGWGVTNESATLVDLGSLSIAASTSPLLNIQMGRQIQSSWMRLNTSIGSGGIVLTGFTLNDTDSTGNGGGGGIKTDLQVTNKGSTTVLDTDIGIDATSTGLKLTLTKLGLSGTGPAGGMDVRMTNLILGNTAGTTYVGDIELLGLNLNGTTVTVAGH